MTKIECDNCKNKYRRRGMKTVKDKLLCHNCYLKEKKDRITYFPEDIIIERLKKRAKDGLNIDANGTVYASKILRGKKIKFIILSIE